MEKIIEALDYCTEPFEMRIDGKNFKEFENRKEYLKSIIDELEDDVLEHILLDLMYYHPKAVDESENDYCEQCGDHNMYTKFTISK